MKPRRKDKFRDDRNYDWPLTACYGTVSQPCLEGLFPRSGVFLNLESPYVRVALDRSRHGGREKRSMTNTVELSMAARVEPHSSELGTRLLILVSSET